MFWDVLGTGCWTAVERCRGPEPSIDDCAEFDRWLVIKNDPCCTMLWSPWEDEHKSHNQFIKIQKIRKDWRAPFGRCAFEVSTVGEDGGDVCPGER